MIARAVGLSRACTVTCHRCGTLNSQPAGATHWRCPGCRVGFVVSDGPPSPGPSLRPGRLRPLPVPALRRGSAPPPRPSAASLSGMALRYGSEGPIRTFVGDRPDRLTAGGKLVIEAGAFALGLRAGSPVQLFAEGWRRPIGSTLDGGLEVSDARHVLRVLARPKTRYGEVLADRAARGRVRLFALPQFDWSGASFDGPHYGVVRLLRATLTGVLLSTRSEWPVGPLSVAG